MFVVAVAVVVVAVEVVVLLVIPLLRRPVGYTEITLGIQVATIIFIDIGVMLPCS